VPGSIRERLDNVQEHTDRETFWARVEPFLKFLDRVQRDVGHALVQVGENFLRLGPIFLDESDERRVLLKCPDPLIAVTRYEGGLIVIHPRGKTPCQGVMGRSNALDRSGLGTTMAVERGHVGLGQVAHVSAHGGFDRAATDTGERGLLEKNLVYEIGSFRVVARHSSPFREPAWAHSAPASSSFSR